MKFKIDQFFGLALMWMALSLLRVAYVKIKRPEAGPRAIRIGIAMLAASVVVLSFGLSWFMK